MKVTLSLTALLVGLAILPAHAQTLTVTNNLQLWLRADAGVTTSGTNVTGWADQTTNANHASQGTAAAQPTLVTNALNGKPVVRFDGTNDFMSIPDSASLDFGTGDFSIFAVFNQTNNINAAYGYGLLYGKFGGSSPFAGATVFLNLNGDGVVTFRTSSAFSLNSTSGFDDLKTRVWEFARAGTTLSERINAVTHASGTTPVVDLDNANPALIGGQAGNVQPFRGDLAEFLIYNTNLSATERQDINEYLFAKYAIPEPSLAALAIPFILILFRRRRATNHF